MDECEKQLSQTGLIRYCKSSFLSDLTLKLDFMSNIEGPFSIHLIHVFLLSCWSGMTSNLQQLILASVIKYKTDNTVNDDII